MNYLQNMDEKIIQKIYFHGKCILRKIIRIACIGTMFTSHYSKISLYVWVVIHPIPTHIWMIHHSTNKNTLSLKQCYFKTNTCKGIFR